MENWATINFAPRRVPTVPEEFTEIHSALMMVSLACRPRMTAENLIRVCHSHKLGLRAQGKPCLGSKWLD